MSGLQRANMVQSYNNSKLRLLNGVEKKIWGFNGDI